MDVEEKVGALCTRTQIGAIRERSSRARFPLVVTKVRRSRERLENGEGNQATGKVPRVKGERTADQRGRH